MIPATVMPLQVPVHLLTYFWFLKMFYSALIDFVLWKNLLVWHCSWGMEKKNKQCPANWQWSIKKAFNFFSRPICFQTGCALQNIILLTLGPLVPCHKAWPAGSTCPIYFPLLLIWVKNERYVFGYVEWGLLRVNTLWLCCKLISPQEQISFLLFLLVWSLSLQRIILN